MSDRINIGLTDRQRRMVDHAARLLWIGCGTKTGKTVGLASWIADGLLHGGPCAWVGPWFPRTRTGFENVRSLLQPLIDAGKVRASETLLRLRHLPSGGTLECFSADNPQGLFGGNYTRIVLDEASRMPESILTAALTTVSATRGQLRCAFNLELGSKNWAIRNLLRVQRMTAEERAASGEDFLTFPSGGDGLVSPETIAVMRASMPEVLWRALYLAEIPADDVSVFRNLDAIFTGKELGGPFDGRSYVAGIDLARKRNFSVITIVDSESGDVVAGDRFSEISWGLQCERTTALCKQFRCGKVFIDATGLGDPIAEALRAAGLPIEPVIFTVRERTSLIERLIVACDKIEIHIPASERFAPWRHELESFECQLDGSSVHYGPPAGIHDDCVMSLALALKGKRVVPVFGLLELMKKGWDGFVGNWRDSKAALLRRPTPTLIPNTSNAKPAQSSRELVQSSSRFDPEQLPPCTKCSWPHTNRIAGGALRCQQCGHQFWLPGTAPKIPYATFVGGKVGIKWRTP